MAWADATRAGHLGELRVGFLAGGIEDATIWLLARADDPSPGVAGFSDLAREVAEALARRS